jgi:hypothetical protein
MVRCIDCIGLDIGFNTDTDAWVHCSAKHSIDIAKQLYRKQQKITEEMAKQEIVCQHFQKRNEKSTIFHLAKEMGVE